MNSQGVKKSGIIFIGALAVFIATALSTLTAPGNAPSGFEANQSEDRPVIALASEKPVLQADLNVIARQ